MLKGDLASTPLQGILRELADGVATGCLHVVDPASETAKIFLRGGRVYAVNAPGRRPQLGLRLVSSGALSPEALAEALEAQRTELEGWRLGELLVHLGYVDQPVVVDFVNEQVRESLSDVLPWSSGTWKFRVNEKTREDIAPPVDVEVLLGEIDARRSTWDTIGQTVHGPDAVPVLSAAGTASAEMEIDADAWSLLCKVDGTRTLTALARECGLTLYEAGQVVFTLVGNGLLEIEYAERGNVASDLGPDLGPAAIANRLVSALTAPPTAVRPEPQRHLEPPADVQSVNGSIARVSEALAGLLGPATASDNIFSAPLNRPARPAPLEDPKKADRARREATRRAADAEELAVAQAELEAARAAEKTRREGLLPDGHVADVVDLQEARRESERAEAARFEDQRLAAIEADAEAVRLEQARLATELAALSTQQDEWPRQAHTRAAHTQAAAFAELSASASLDLPEPVLATSVLATKTWDDEPLPSYGSGDTDTAALLRELSSLGLDDDPPPPTTRPVRPPAPRAGVTLAKKKKGLFGRS